MGGGIRSQTFKERGNYFIIGQATKLPGHWNIAFLKFLLSSSKMWWKKTAGARGSWLIPTESLARFYAICTGQMFLQKCLKKGSSGVLLFFLRLIWQGDWLLLRFLKGVHCVIWWGSRQVRELVEMLLLLANIPMQAFGQRSKPVRDLILGANRRHWINGCGHMKAVSMLEFLALTSVKRHPSRVTTVRRNCDL